MRWPDGWPRTSSYRRENDHRFRGTNVGRARDQLMHELRLAGATDIVVSSNVPVKADGLLYADNKRIDDPGIAVYFTYKKKKLVMAREKRTSCFLD
jgi:hypothetical protein